MKNKIFFLILIFITGRGYLNSNEREYYQRMHDLYLADFKEDQLKDLHIIVKIGKQELYLLDREEILASYQISTSVNGEGNAKGSYKTPLGKHLISHKIGKSAARGTIFKSLVDTKKISPIYQDQKFRDSDDVTSRILRLEGLEEGINENSFERYIYIHGTPEEGLIGTKASHGCIRMKNDDIINLFEKVEVGTIVDIVK